MASFWCNKIVHVSKAYLKGYWFVPKKKELVIYNGIDFSTFKKKKERNDNQYKIIFVAPAS